MHVQCAVYSYFSDKFIHVHAHAEYFIRYPKEIHYSDLSSRLISLFLLETDIIGLNLNQPEVTTIVFLFHTHQHTHTHISIFIFNSLHLVALLLFLL